jgi:hypothetical protein
MADLTRTCACGCGTPVTGKWARGHFRRGEGGYQGRDGVQAIPAPDDPWWELDGGGPHDDIGIIEPDAAPESPPPADLPGGGDETGPGYEPGPVLEDPPPAHGNKREWRKTSPKAGAPRKPAKVTASVRTDIDAKISFALMIPGQIWAARDPVCGGTFVQQRPEISAALTEIVCQSPDLIAWFSGSGGQFMLWLNLAAAAWPVATAAMAHHVYHSIETGEPQADTTRYAA